ncbi:hypothetical protein ACFWN2_04470 [Lentzea sp. NPDC058436]|uniref:hypothetical protein n=1 Tax=Lentzea sp. NPDC058436 TaxID=3346499 RepID=UPI003653AD29
MASWSPAVEVLADVVGWSGHPKWQPDWKRTEDLLGTTLPDDYKALLDTIPFGEYAGTALVGPATITGREGDHLAMFRDLMLELADDKHPYDAYPKLPGLIPWAVFDYPVKGQLFWLADDGDPNHWPVVVRGTNGSWERHDLGAVPFLISLVRGTLSSKVVERNPGAEFYRTLQDLPGAPNNTGR